jgi:O-antigen ligase
VLSTILVFIGTFSTGAFFAIAACSPVVLIWMWKGSSVTFKAGALAMAVSAIAVMSGFAVPQSARDIFQMRTIDRAGEIDWPEAATIDFLQNEPRYLVFGVGFGNIGFHTYKYLKVDANTSRYLLSSTLPLASKALTILAETGGLGLLLFVGFQLTAIVRSARVARWESSRESRVVLYGLIAGCTGCVALELFNWSPFTPLFFGLMSGYSYRCFGERRNRSRLAASMAPASHLAVGAGS